MWVRDSRWFLVALVLSAMAFKAQADDGSTVDRDDSGERGFLVGVGVGVAKFELRGPFGDIDTDKAKLTAQLTYRVNRYLGVQLSAQDFGGIHRLLDAFDDFDPTSEEFDFASRGYGAAIVARAWPERWIRPTARIGVNYQTNWLKFTDRTLGPGFVEICSINPQTSQRECRQEFRNVVTTTVAREERRHTMSVEVGVGVEWEYLPRYHLALNVDAIRLDDRYFNNTVQVDALVKTISLGWYCRPF